MKKHLPIIANIYNKIILRFSKVCVKKLWRVCEQSVNKCYNK